MDTIPYLTSQIHRMNDDQIDLVSRVALAARATKLEETRLAQLYMWLHMQDGSIAHRRFTTMVGLPGKRWGKADPRPRKHRPKWKGKSQ